ncbi:MAG TPA: c-type cytochrome [Rhodanobacteraceae bacterium]|jgi:ketosteroid isomerase-like protein|nr:c-type cytochrome [Rhodanobacteraceae bacterium]
MKRHIEHVLVLVAAAVVVAIGLGVFVYSGIYNIGADDHHTKPVFAVLQALRNRSIHVRSDSIKVPNLDDPQLILKGAGQYAAMCTGCHLRPGVENSELRKGMYPQPPNLSKVHVDPQDAFWVIKHGIKMSAMPAWGLDGSHDDETIWSMVAFLEKLPGMTPAQYKAIVAKAPPDEDMDMDMGSESGHSHSHGEGEHDDDHAAPASGMSVMPGMTMTPNGMRSTSGSSQTGAMQAMLKPGAAPQAEAVAQAFQDALKDGDRANALALLTPDAQISEGGETQSAKEYATHHLGEDIAFLKDAKVKHISRASMQMNDTAMVVSESDIQATVKGKLTKSRSRELLTLKKDGKDWKIVSIRWESAPLPGE